jgi:hypothetical protein
MLAVILVLLLVFVVWPLFVVITKGLTQSAVVLLVAPFYLPYHLTKNRQNMDAKEKKLWRLAAWLWCAVVVISTFAILMDNIA